MQRAAAFDYVREDWRTAGTVSAEFHGSSGRLFTEEVLPRAHELRRLYAQRYPAWCGCLEEKRTPQEHVPPSLAVATSGNELATVEAKPSI